MGLAWLAPVGPAKAQTAVAPITMVINQSPWFSGFERLIDRYTKATGNKIELDVNPYGAMLEKIRNSLRSGTGTYDLLAIDANWMVEMFAAGYLAPIDDVEPGFALDPKVSTFDGSIYWNAESRTFDPVKGRLMGVPINGNVDVLYYRADLYEKAGLKVAETWDELLSNVVKLKDPPRLYGFVHFDDRAFTMVDFSNFMFSFGGGVFADPRAGDFRVVFNSPQNLKAIQFFIDLGKQGGYPSPGSVSQGQLFQLLATGKAAHGIGVVAAMAQFDDPSQSAVVGKLNAALMPRASNGVHAARAGHWIGAIARNVPDEKQLAALAFLKWFQTRDHQIDYTRFGAIPVRNDIADSELAKDPKFRFLGAMSANAAVARIPINVPEAPQLMAITNLRLNEAVIGHTPPAQALNQAAHEIYDVMTKAGYKTALLPDLP
jgi:multiple sugar transport system substrate-binding protein